MVGSRGTRPLARLALTGGMVLAGITVAGPAANAGASCSYPYCSETYNQSQYYVIVAHDWCGNQETLYQDAPPCASNSPVRLLSGNHTPATEDWDVLRVDRGWKYTVQVYSVIWGWSSVGSFDNRNGSTQMWVRVHNDQTMYVRSQST